MKTLLLSLIDLFFFFWATDSNAQCAQFNCPAGQVAGAKCAEDACIISSLSQLDGLTGRTSSFSNFCNIPGPFCGSVENNLWYAFVATTDSMTLHFEVENCLDNPSGGGIQAQIFSSADCQTFEATSDCWSPGVPDTGRVTAIGMEVGQVYYLMIDSWGGDLCDFSMHLDCAILATDPKPLSTFTGPLAVCPGQVAEYVADVPECLTDLQWEFDGNGGMVVSADTTTATIVWGSSIAGNLCLSGKLPDGTVEEYCRNFFNLQVNAIPDTISPAWNSQFELDLCLGESVFIEARDPSDGNANLTFEYYFGDGGYHEGRTVNYEYRLPGEFELVMVAASDACAEADTFFLPVNVRPAPNVSVEVVPEGAICQGGEIALSLSSGPDTFFFSGRPTGIENYEPARGLPDGTGLYSESVISIANALPGTTVTSVENMKVGLEMEHSKMQDLEITLTCPNGQSALLHEYSGSAVEEIKLGVPFEDDEGAPPVPGFGFKYTWAHNAPNGTWTEYANAFFPSTLPVGNYLANESLENFLGCPVNGDWTMTVTDHHNFNNGVVFSASVEVEVFDSSFLAFESTAEWLDDPTVTSYAPQNIVVMPDSSTIYSFDLSNDLGCTQQVGVPVEIIPANDPQCLPCDSLSVEAGVVEITCAQGLPIATPAISTYPPNVLNHVWTVNGAVVSTSQYVSVAQEAEYIVTVEYLELGCFASDTLELINTVDLPVANAGPDVSLNDCPDIDLVLLDASASSSGPEIEYQWKNITGTVISESVATVVDATGIYELVVTNINSGCVSNDLVIVTPAQPISIEITTTPDSCNLSVGTAAITLNPEQLDMTYLWNNGSTDSIAYDLADGTHAVIVGWGLCPTTAVPAIVENLDCSTGVADPIEGLNGILLSPNPTEGLATLIFNLEKTAELEMSLMDALGRAVGLGFAPQKLTPGEHFFDLDLSGLPGGVYFLKIQNGEGQVSTLRVVKQ